MYSKRDGLPEESDIVLCTVTKIQYHSVFVSLNEYPGKSAMLHISEISPGRIRNINDYVKEGKVIVCKVLKVDLSKGHIDVSLRRVSESQRRTKLDILKQQQRADKIISFVAEKEKVDAKKLKQKILDAIRDKYEYIFEAFADISKDSLNISELKLDKKVEKQLHEIIIQRIKPPVIEIKGKLKLESHESNGVSVVKDVLLTIQKMHNDFLISYLGAGTYLVEIKGEDYKALEDEIEKMENYLEDLNPKSCAAHFQRT